jgi:hypothetical protein
LKSAEVASDVSRLLRFSPLKKAGLGAVLSILARRFDTKAAKLAREEDKYEIDNIERFDDRFDRLWREFIAGRSVISIKRSAAFLNWRYIDMPYRRYSVFAATSGGRIVGYACAAVVTREDMDLRLKVGVISDFLVLPGHEAAFPSLVRRAAEAWRSGGADVAIVWVHRDGQFSRSLVSELKRWGLVSTRGRYDIPFLVRTLGDTIDAGSFYEVANWHVTQAFGGAWV